MRNPLTQPPSDRERFGLFAVHEERRLTAESSTAHEPATTRTGDALWRRINQLRLEPDQERVLKERSAGIAALHGCAPLLSRLLAQRGWSAGAELKAFLEPEVAGLPAPEALKGTRELTALFARALREGAHFAIAGDFDVDGMCATTLCAEFLECLGIPYVNLSPSRIEDGYGLNAGIVRTAHAAGHKILITLDMGSRNFEELRLAADLGLDAVVVDHHACLEDRLPAASAFLNPRQAGCSFGQNLLCATGVLWFALRAVQDSLSGCLSDAQASKVTSWNPMQALDLVTLATIADVMPLQGVNRILVTAGLKRLTSTERPGLQQIARALGGAASEESQAAKVAFGYGPLINALGRVRDRDENGVNGALTGFELLHTRDQERARVLALETIGHNLRRQELQERVVDVAVRQVSSRATLPAGIVVSGRDFHPGVVGPACSRVGERFHRPTVIFSEGARGISRGSSRGLAGFDVLAALERCKAPLLKFGGHPQAGGITLLTSRIPEFRALWEEECARQLSPDNLRSTVTPELTLDFARLEEQEGEIAHCVAALEPCGAGNVPLHVLGVGLRVAQAYIIKERHLKVCFRQEDVTREAFLWNYTHHPALALRLSEPQVGMLICQRRYPVDVVFRVAVDPRPEAHGLSRLSYEIVAAEMRVQRSQ